MKCGVRGRCGAWFAGHGVTRVYSERLAEPCFCHHVALGLRKFVLGESVAHASTNAAQGSSRRFRSLGLVSPCLTHSVKMDVLGFVSSSSRLRLQPPVCDSCSVPVREHFRVLERSLSQAAVPVTVHSSTSRRSPSVSQTRSAFRVARTIRQCHSA